jgi:hypothetical protein
MTMAEKPSRREGVCQVITVSVHEAKAWPEQTLNINNEIRIA